jgi:hypothetical protein
MKDESQSGGAGQLSKFTGLRGKACVAQARRSLVSRLADCDAAIAVALEIARDGNVVPQARAAALQTIASLMSSSASIAMSLARMKGRTSHHMTIERLGENAPKCAEKNMDRQALSTAESAAIRQKLKANPQGEGGRRIFHAEDEPDKHLPPFRVR